jgi:hypothetical protein
MASQGDLVEPLNEYDGLDPEEIVEEMRDRTEFALALDPKSHEAGAAAGLVVAIGNYEAATGGRRAVLEAATERLKELEEGERSKYW